MSRAREFADLAGSADAGGITGRNLMINGAMLVAQRGTSSTSSGAHTLDRFFNSFATVAVTQSQDTTVPSGEGFTKSFKQEFTTASSSAAAYYSVYTTLEGQDLINSGWDYTSPSSFITISFYIKSSVAGTYTCSFRTAAGTVKAFSFQYTLAADTWTRVTKSIPGNSGITINNDSTKGMNIFLNVQLGTDYTDSGRTHDIWDDYSSTAQTPPTTNNNMTTVNSTIHITGVQLEVGKKATPFEHRSFGDELARCQRYFTAWTHSSVYYGAAYGSGNGFVLLDCPVRMRAIPTVTVSSTRVAGADTTSYNSQERIGIYMAATNPYCGTSNASAEIT